MSGEARLRGVDLLARRRDRAGHAAVRVGKSGCRGDVALELGDERGRALLALGEVATELVDRVLEQSRPGRPPPRPRGCSTAASPPLPAPIAACASGELFVGELDALPRLIGIVGDGGERFGGVAGGERAQVLVGGCRWMPPPSSAAPGRARATRARSARVGAARRAERAGGARARPGRSGRRPRHPSTAPTSACGTLAASYAPEALATVADNPEQARQRIAFADEQLAAAQAAIGAGKGGEAAVGIRAAEEAVGQAVLLQDAIDKLGRDLAEGEQSAAALIAELEQDIAAASALPDPDGRVAGGDRGDPPADRRRARRTSPDTARRPLHDPAEPRGGERADRRRRRRASGMPRPRRSARSRWSAS